MADAAHWATVALVAVVALVSLKLLAATAVGAAIPGLRTLAAFA